MGEESVFVGICMTIGYNKLRGMRCSQTGDIVSARNCGTVGK